MLKESILYFWIMQIILLYCHDQAFCLINGSVYIIVRDGFRIFKCFADLYLIFICQELLELSANKGIPVLNGRGRGDQYVTVYIETPRNLNREQKEALKKFSESLGEKNYEEHKGFFGKFKL